MDGLGSADAFCLQDLVPANGSASGGDRGSGGSSSSQQHNGLNQSRSSALDTSIGGGHHSLAGHDNSAFDTSAANSAYRFSSMQPFGCPSSAGHFMSQSTTPLQPLPLAYPQVSHIPNHSAYGQSAAHQSVGFNSMATSGLHRHHPSMTGHTVHHGFDTTDDYFDKPPLQPNTQTFTAITNKHSTIDDSKHRKGKS